MDANSFRGLRAGEARQTFARTITEANIVFHAGHSGDFFPTAWTLGARLGLLRAYRARTMTFAIGIGLTASHISPALSPMAMNGCAS